MEEFWISAYIPKTQGKLTPTEKREFKKLPRCSIKGQRKGTIEFLSESFVCDDASLAETLEHFNRAAKEILSVLEAQAQRPSGKGSSFDFTAMLTDAQRILSRESISMTEIREAGEAALEKYHAFLDEPLTWASPELDWDDPKYHKNARTLLNRPIFWSIGSPYSPNGSDMGADVLSHYESAIGKPGRFDRPRLLRQLLLDVASPEQIRDAQNAEEDKTQFENDRVSYVRINQTVIAFAVANIKFDARCSKSIVQFALACIRRELRDYNLKQLRADEQYKKDYRHLASRLRNQQIKMTS